MTKPTGLLCCCNRSTTKSAHARNPNYLSVTDIASRSLSNLTLVASSFGSMVDGDSGDQHMGKAEVVEKEIIAEIEHMAAKLEAHVQKYPKSGKGFLNCKQDRYIAAIPEPEGSCSGYNGTLSPQIRRWKYGNLAYWENPNAFKKKEAPKGHLALFRIAKVQCAKDDFSGRGVIIKHKHGKDMHELVLLFPTKRDAEEWSYLLWDFLTRLHEVCEEQKLPS